MITLKTRSNCSHCAKFVALQIKDLFKIKKLRTADAEWIGKSESQNEAILELVKSWKKKVFLTFFGYLMNIFDDNNVLYNV